VKKAMDRQQRRAAVRERLIGAPQASNRAIARALGVGHPLVAELRRGLEVDAKIRCYRAHGGRRITVGQPVDLLAALDGSLETDTMRVEIRCSWQGRTRPIAMTMPPLSLPVEMPQSDARGFAQAIGKAALRWALSRS
jgi:hypothetical protein